MAAFLKSPLLVLASQFNAQITLKMFLHCIGLGSVQWCKQWLSAVAFLSLSVVAPIQGVLRDWHELDWNVFFLISTHRWEEITLNRSVTFEPLNQTKSSEIWEEEVDKKVSLRECCWVSNSNCVSGIAQPSCLRTICLMKGPRGLTERARTAACPAIARFTSENTDCDMGSDCNLNLKQTWGLWWRIHQSLCVCCVMTVLPSQSMFGLKRFIGFWGA